MSMQLNVTVNPIFNNSAFASAGASAGASFSAGLNSAVSRTQPLGRITGDVSEFQKSMEAANARVLAFGASAGAIYVVKSAFDKLINSTLQVEKSLADINTVLGLGAASMRTFSNEMFKAAGITGQTFETASKVALEFSRQGASATETIKRMTAAMQLMRISGLSAEESVNSITSSLNAFSREMLTAEDVVNRLTAVDTRFAVSSRDLANAIQRVGSVANDAGIQFNELLGLVTAAQTITARGGAVIGNAFKSIFTRLARPQVLEDLEAVGISTRNASGQILPMITVLKNLANQYNSLGASQRSFIAESVGGVYQINILKAALTDLGNGVSIFDRAAMAATQSTGLIEKRMAELNETISSKLNVSALEMTKLFSNIGQKAFGSGAKGAIDLFNKNLRTISSGFEDFAPDDSVGLRIGKIVAQGITKGIGNVLSGPGMQIATVLLIKMFSRLGAFAIQSGKDFLQANDALNKQKDIVQSINNFLSANPQILAAIQAGQLNINQAHLVYLQQLQQENQLKQQSASLAATMANRAAPYITASKSPTPATGFIPNFALSESEMEKRMAISHGYAPGPTYKTLIHDGKGKSSLTTVNAAETVKTITNGDGHKATFVIPPNGFGKNTLFAAKGFIPNFAQTNLPTKNNPIHLSGDIEVEDGDTIKADSIIYHSRRGYRLSKVDAVEKRQTLGDKAAKLLQDRIGNKDSFFEKINQNGKAAYDRGLFTHEQVAKELIDQGLGVPDIRYTSDYKTETEAAKNKKIGIWGFKDKNDRFTHPKAIQYNEQANIEDIYKNAESDLEKQKSKALYKAAEKGRKKFDIKANSFIPNFAAENLQGQIEAYKYDFFMKVKGKDRPVAPSDISKLSRDYELQLLNGGLAKLGFMDAKDLNSVFGPNVEADFLAKKSSIPYLIDAKAGYGDAQTSEMTKKMSTISNFRTSQKYRDYISQLGIDDSQVKLAIIYGNMGPLQEKTFKKKGLLSSKLAEGFVPNFASENAIKTMKEMVERAKNSKDPSIINEAKIAKKRLEDLGYASKQIKTDDFQASFGSSGIDITLTDIDEQFDIEEAAIREYGKNAFVHIQKNSIEKLKNLIKNNPNLAKNFGALKKEMGDSIRVAETPYAAGFVPNFFNYLNEARNILKESGLNLDNINNQNFSQFKEVIKSKVGGTNIGEYEKALENYLYGGSTGWSLKKPSSKSRGGYREFGSGFVPNFAYNYYSKYSSSYGRQAGSRPSKSLQREKEERRRQKELYGGYFKSPEITSNPWSKNFGKDFSASGFVPNFALDGLSDAINREMAAGYSHSEVKIGYDSRLKESGGVGVYNKDEGNLANAINIHLASGKSLSKIQKQGAASGFVPNFAEGDVFKTSAFLGVAQYLQTNSQKFGKFLDLFTSGLNIGAKKMSEMFQKFDGAKKKLDEFQAIKAAGGTLTAKEQVEEQLLIKELKNVSADFKKMTGRDITTVSDRAKARIQFRSGLNLAEIEERQEKIRSRAGKVSIGAGAIGGFASTIAESFGEKDLAKGIDSFSQGISQAGQAVSALPNMLGGALAVGLLTKKLSEGFINIKSGVEAANKAYEQHKTVVERTNSALTDLQDGYQVLGNLVQSGNASISELNTINKKIAQSMAQLAAVSPEYARRMQTATTPEARSQVQAEIREEQGLKSKELGFSVQYRELQKKNMGMFGLVNYARGEKYGQFTAASESEVPVMEQMKSEAATLIQEQVLSTMERGSPEERQKAAGIRQRFTKGEGTEEDIAEIQKRMTSTSGYKMLGDDRSKAAVEEKLNNILKELTIPKEKREAYRAALDQIQNAQIKEANLRKRYNQEIQNLLSRGTALSQFANQQQMQTLGQKGRKIETKYGLEEQNFRLQSLVTSEADMARMRGESKQKQIQEQAGLDVERIKTSTGASQLTKLGEVISETASERMSLARTGPGEPLPGVDPRTLGLKTFFAKRQEMFSGEGAAKLFEASKKKPEDFAREFLGKQEESGISKEDYESLLQKVTTKAASGDFTKETGDSLTEIKDVLEKSNEDAKKSAAETQAAIKEANFKELAGALGGLSLLAKGGERQMRRRIRRAEYLSERGRTAQARGRGAAELLSLIPESQRDINNPYVSRLYGQVQSGMLAANTNVLRGSRLGGSGVMGNLGEMAFAQTFGNLKASGMGADFYKQAGLQIPEANIEPLNQSVSQAAQDIQNFGAMLRSLGSDADNLKRALESAAQERQQAVQNAENVAGKGAPENNAGGSGASSGLQWKQLLGEYAAPIATTLATGVMLYLTRGKVKASGHIPNFGKGNMPDFSSVYKEKIQASMLGASNAGVVPGVGTINGESFLANSAETQIPNFMGSGETAVIPKYGDGERKAFAMLLSGKSGPVLNAAGGSIPDLTRHFTNSRASASVLKDNFAKGNIPDLNEFFEKVGKSRQSPKEYLRTFLRNKDISSLDISIDELKKLKDIGIDINNIKGKKGFSAVAKIKSIDELQEFMNLSGKGTKDLTKFLEGRDFSMEEYKKLIGMGFEKEISGASLKIKSLDELKELRQIGSNLTNKELAEHFVKQSKNLSETQSKYLVKTISKQLEKGIPSQAVELGKSGGLLANAKDMIGGGKGLLQAGANWKKALKTSMGIGSKAGLFGMALQAGLLVNDLFESQDLREKGESGEANKLIGGSVGGLAGAVIGGALGSFFGPLGTIAGSYLGSMAGRWVGEGIGSIFPDSEKDVEKKLMNMRNAKKQRVENEKALAELKDRMKQRKLKQYEEGMTSSLGYMKERGAFKDGRYDYKAISENIIKNKDFENVEHLKILRKRMAEERGAGMLNYQQTSAMDTGLVGGLILSDKKSFEEGMKSFTKSTGKLEGEGRYGDLEGFISGPGKAIASGTAVTGAHLMEIGKRTSAEDQYKLLTNQYADKALEKLLSSGQNLDLIRKQYPDLDLTAANDIDQLADVMMGKPLAPKINPQTTKFLREKLRAEGVNGELFKIMQDTYFETEQTPKQLNISASKSQNVQTEPTMAAGNIPDISNIQASQNQKTLSLNSIASQKGSNQIDLSVEFIKKLESIALASSNTARNSEAGNQLLAKILNARNSDLGKPATA